MKILDATHNEPLPSGIGTADTRALTQAVGMPRIDRPEGLAFVKNSFRGTGATLLPMPQPDMAGPLTSQPVKFRHMCKVDEVYAGEDKGLCPKYASAVTYLNAEERIRYKATPRDGRLLNGRNEPIDTTHIPTKVGKTGGLAMFAMDEHGHIYVGEKTVGEFHHSSFLGGAPAAAAGYLRIEKGKLTAFSANSGHYTVLKKHQHQFFTVLADAGIGMAGVRMVDSRVDRP